MEHAIEGNPDLGVGFPAEFVFEYQAGLFSKLRRAFERNDLEELHALWKTAIGGKPHQVPIAGFRMPCSHENRHAHLSGRIVETEAHPPGDRTLSATQAGALKSFTKRRTLTQSTPTNR
jgi:hypothetical protein